jgi:threonine/homoserine/homoserine lactone efflux protein
VAAAAGLTGLIAASELGFTIVKYAGAAYLVYLGVRKFLEHEEAPEEASSSAHSRLFVRGVLVQLLNPKIAIFFLAFLPQFVDSTGPIALQIMVLGTIFTLLAALSDSAYVLLAAVLGGWMRNGGRARRRLAKVSGGVYIGLGVGAALSGTSHATPTTAMRPR